MFPHQKIVCLVCRAFSKNCRGAGYVSGEVCALQTQWRAPSSHYRTRSHLSGQEGEFDLYLSAHLLIQGFKSTGWLRMTPEPPRIPVLCEFWVPVKRAQRLNRSFLEATLHVTGDFTEAVTALWRGSPGAVHTHKKYFNKFRYLHFLSLSLSLSPSLSGKAMQVT